MAPAAPPAPLTLSDAQIERYSRQIVLTEIGGTGQLQLLATSVLVLGSGPLAETVAFYLAGAGIGRIGLEPAQPALGAALVDLNADVVIAAAASRTEAYDVVVACDAEPAAIAAASKTGAGIIAGGADGDGGWLAVSQRGGACAVCAALHHAETPHGAAPTVCASAAAGAVGSLIALEVVKQRLDLGSAPSGERRLDVRSATLTDYPIATHPRCTACAGAERR